MTMDRLHGNGKTPVGSNKAREDRRDSTDDATFMKSIVDRPSRIKAAMHLRH